MNTFVGISVGAAQISPRPSLAHARDILLKALMMLFLRTFFQLKCC